MKIKIDIVSEDVRLSKSIECSYGDMNSNIKKAVDEFYRESLIDIVSSVLHDFEILRCHTRHIATDVITELDKRNLIK